jgi:hypothetical protein
MRFLHVDPKARTVKPVDADSPSSAVPSLTSLNTDHGVVSKDPDGGGISIIVYEYGLLEGEGPYFSLGTQLYSGDAVLYAFDYAGETIDMPKHLDAIIPIWLADKSEAELAIAAGVVRRPQAAINGLVTWEWS